MLEALVGLARGVLGLFALVETVAVVVFGASILAYQDQPSVLYIITGGTALVVAIWASLD